ncbi:MAG: 6-carboxytetrahydropterin synthase QueD [Kiritimatiellae bacterium]|nr:6-carboxytetrahydropterin synthase QueD [Kiritimatiellia bacterium]
MYEISVKTHFSAAHRLQGYAGDCARLHGHNWEVEVFLRGEYVNEIGFLTDFRGIKHATREALAALDHTDLNELPGLAGANPTSENLARHLYSVLGAALNNARCRVHRVRVSEMTDTGASYWEE